MKFQITSQAGLDMGVWDGSTKAEALLAMHSEAGYGPDVVWLATDGSGALAFDCEDTRRLCGDVSDWWIDARSEPLKRGVLGLGKCHA